VNVEIKNDPDDPDHDPGGASIAAAVGDRLAARLGAAGPASEGDEAQPHRPDQLLVSSFDHEVLAHVRASHPELAAAALVFRLGRVGRLMAELAEQGMAAINPWDPLVDAAVVDAAHDAGLAVNVWTVDDPDRMGQLLELGVDGIITNVPDVARQVVDGAS
jgi:glycerophosphoryl diester phosphodiesterase